MDAIWIGSTAVVTAPSAEDGDQLLLGHDDAPLLGVDYAWLTGEEVED
jgi:hypothetical protein